MSGAAAQRSVSEPVATPSGGGRRLYDAQAAAWMVKVFPGEFYATARKDEMLVTVLGSCVSACIRDPFAGVGGMNHFMLPQHKSGAWGGDTSSARFGNFAMEKLINELIKMGASRERFEVKVFGGGNVTDSSIAVGSDNADFVLRYLDAEGLTCAAQDLGGTLPRRIHYYPATGRVVRKLLRPSESYAVSREESDYGGRLRGQKMFGEIQLFGES
ncbi:MAG: chemoreceptor glutamine deamidase CheD [Pseudolabrys sp.]|jgi:chemotaxis protein CheD